MLRNLLFTLLLLGGVSAGLHAQINPIQLGIQASPTFNWLSTDQNLIESDGTKLGLKLGLIAEYYFQENYSFHTGINFHFGAVVRWPARLFRLTGTIQPSCWALTIFITTVWMG